MLRTILNSFDSNRYCKTNQPFQIAVEVLENNKMPIETNALFVNWNTKLTFIVILTMPVC